MARITQDSLQKLFDNIDIIELISSYIDVRKEGANYMALCPFHNEKTPSFSISQIKGLYHCFGCGASGNAVTFVREYEHLGFVDAVEKIAKFFNVKLEYEAGSLETRKSDILPSIAMFYHNNLLHNKEVLEYLLSRKVSLDSIKKFELGYSGASFETLHFLDRNDFSHKEAIEYGILVSDVNKNYAKFTKRIMFPIHSKSGVVVGFGGRILENRENVPKYLNSPQTKVFNKSKILYGYNLAKVAISKENSIIICEGYLDVIMLHQAGFNNAVATLGTAFNEKHLSVINRENPRIYMCYDGDNAGLNAAFKAAKLLSQNSKDGGVVILDNNLDPADMIAQGKIAEFKLALSNARDFVEFVISGIISNFDISNPMQKELALKAVLEYYHTLSPILQDSYKKKVALFLDINENYIRTKDESIESKRHFGRDFNPSMLIKKDSSNAGEEMILMNMLENDEHFFYALNFLSKKHFRDYGDEFELIAQGKSEDSKIMALRFKSDSKMLNGDEFKEHIRKFMLHYALNLLESMKQDPSINPQERITKSMSIKQDIEKLQKGEIISI